MSQTCPARTGCTLSETYVNDKAKIRRPDVNTVSNISLGRPFPVTTFHFGSKLKIQLAQNVEVARKITFTVHHAHSYYLSIR